MINFTVNKRKVSGADDWAISVVTREPGVTFPPSATTAPWSPLRACRPNSAEVRDERRNLVVASSLYPIREGI